MLEKCTPWFPQGFFTIPYSFERLGGIMNFSTMAHREHTKGYMYIHIYTCECIIVFFMCHGITMIHTRSRGISPLRLVERH
jgi:hypothetical protein